MCVHVLKKFQSTATLRDFIYVYIIINSLRSLIHNRYVKILSHFFDNTCMCLKKLIYIHGGTFILEHVAR